MQSPRRRQLVAWSVRAYGALLRLYPPAFRRQYAKHMQAAFEDGLLTVNGAPMSLPITGLQ